MTEIVSPCKNTCSVNKDNVCLGCGRTVDEITGWEASNSELKQEIVINSDKRLKEIQAQWPWKQNS
jgi:predicted Fe-S protein YdhL (DUF1289 family)